MATRLERVTHRFVRGDALQILESLAPLGAKGAYLDPPFNRTSGSTIDDLKTGLDPVPMDDGSGWATYMSGVFLALNRHLLPDSVVVLQADDHYHHIGRLLGDSLLNLPFQRTLTWKRSHRPTGVKAIGDAKPVVRDTEFLVVWGKTPLRWPQQNANLGNPYWGNLKIPNDPSRLYRYEVPGHGDGPWPVREEYFKSNNIKVNSRGNMVRWIVPEELVPPSSVVFFKNGRRRTSHQDEKPVGLISRLFHFMEPGDLLLDPFAGSQATRLFAEERDLRWTGIDLHPLENWETDS